ncbi:glycoside hydrolase family 3 N-terminal domain-containing protein [Chloroflexus sp.]|uniref:glycoside hydrolase family 3 N-terminal domain-containing protein n=1 Tax=Chloroflexus sp. TaxID=1904827 RepID=UPI002ACE4682|nr:glycoside hydrolase family 3 N-terminal domain-containing protein [Chloroflexus sp.]MCX7858758.1 glycoside hydrolase family 3 C-terminal domain-containing protein [Chloroflexus sp.]
MNHIEDRINHLLGQMTLEEKIGQLNQPMIHGLPGLDLLRQGQAGSIINAFGALSGQGFDHLSSAEQCNALQRAALESRLGIPLLFGRDIIHGQRTVFPIPLAQAASFNPALVETINRIAAREASAVGIRWTFAPMLDIARDARWGRIAEGYGEDPYLVSRMAEAAVRGFQGDDVSQPDRLVACAKHYVGYGAAEGGRDYEQAEISEPTLRDVYLPPFRAAVAAGVGTVMSAFLDLNGVPATANRRLLTDVLRGEWGFDGFVVSDWESVGELVQHGVAEDRAHAAALALRAGVDMDMVSGAYQETLAGNLHRGLISRAEIDEAVRRILRIKFRAGIFERPFTDPERASRDILTHDARAFARQAARETMVLLKNEHHLLPLRDFRRILIAGPFVHATAELFGTWTMDGRAEDVTPLDRAFQDVAPSGVELWFAAAPDLALARAHYADAIVLLVGEHPARSGENANVSDLGLPPGQLEWITAMAAIGKPVVLVVFAGRPLAITRAVAQAQAVIYAWHPGIEGAAALAEILFGLAAPSGRLPVSMPRATGQAPLYYNRKPSGRPLIDDGPFRTRYVDTLTAPLFPFGYGLTYTRFTYSDLRLSSSRMRGALEVSALITNVGEQAGTEVVQLYVRDLVGSLTRPVRELKGFQRITLQPGEARRVMFTLREEDLAFTRADGSWGTEPGRFKVWIAPHCEAGLEGEFEL